MPRVLLETDFPKEAQVKRTVLHWTGGAHAPNSIDVLHYHFLVAEARNKPEPVPYIVRGKFGLTAVNPPLREGAYAMHTLHCNSNSAAVSICGMLDAVKPNIAGPEPFSEGQWKMAVAAVADIHEAYGIVPSAVSALMHSTVQPVLGIHQLGKWDVDLLPFAPKMAPDEVHAYYLDCVRNALEPVLPGQFSVIWNGAIAADDGFYANGDAMVALRPLSAALGFKIMKAAGDSALIVQGLSVPKTVPLLINGGKGYSPLIALCKALGYGAEYVKSMNTYRIVKS